MSQTTQGTSSSSSLHDVIHKYEGKKNLGTQSTSNSGTQSTSTFSTQHTSNLSTQHTSTSNTQHTSTSNSINSPSIQRPTPLERSGVWKEEDDDDDIDQLLAQRKVLEDDKFKKLLSLSLHSPTKEQGADSHSKQTMRRNIKSDTKNQDKEIYPKTSFVFDSYAIIMSTRFGKSTEDVSQYKSLPMDSDPETTMYVAARHLLTYKCYQATCKIAELGTCNEVFKAAHYNQEERSTKVDPQFKVQLTDGKLTLSYLDEKKVTKQVILKGIDQPITISDMINFELTLNEMQTSGAQWGAISDLISAVESHDSILDPQDF